MAKLRVDKIAAVGVSTETTGSVFFDGSNGASSGDVMTILNQSGLAPGTGDYTAEGWFYFTSLGSENIRLFGNVNGNQANSTGWQLVRFNSDTTLKLWDGDSWEDVGVDVSTGEWIHIAVVRQSNTFTLYKNGVAAPNTVSNSNDLTHSGLDIGARDDGSEPMLGYISNVRLIIGEALYTSNFSVPTRELDVTSNTVFLGLYDGEDIFADKTGNYIISAYGDRSSTPTPASTDSPIGITTFQPGLDRDVDNTFGPTFQGGAGYNSQNWLTLPKGTTTERFVDVASNAVSASSARGIFQGGQVPGNTNVIEYITIASAGNGIDFGDRTIARQYLASVASNTRGVTAGGDPSTNVIDYITISTLGDAQDFGDLFTGRYGMGSCASSIRGVWAGGTPGFVNTIDYVTIATTGDAKDFGDLTTGRVYLTGCGSPSRGLFAGGITPTRLNTIDFITIASMGNAFDFGDLTEVVGQRAGCSSSTRGVFGGGTTPTIVNTIDFVSISSTGNAVDFGDITVAREAAGACSSSTRGVWGGGDSPTKRNTIDFVVLESLGDATDFGDLTAARKGVAGCSNGHGGLG